MLEERQQPEEASDARDGAAGRHHRAQEPEGRSARFDPRARRIALVVAALVALVAVAFGVWQCSGTSDGFFDLNAKEGQAPYKTQEQMQAELDRIVEEGMFNISIASVIQFDEGTSPGTAYIENVPGNRYVMQVSITLDDTSEEVYASKGIKPGQYIESITLSKDLEPGTYPATATFTALDADSLEEVGQAAAKVSLNVLG